MNYVLIICVVWDECKWHCVESSDGFYAVDNSRDSLGTNVGYYPVAHRRHLRVNIRVPTKSTSVSPGINSDQSVTGN